jgi:hypothetical protein
MRNDRIRPTCPLTYCGLQSVARPALVGVPPSWRTGKPSGELLSSGGLSSAGEPDHQQELGGFGPHVVGLQRWLVMLSGGPAFSGDPQRCQRLARPCLVRLRLRGGCGQLVGDGEEGFGFLVVAEA